MSFEHKHVSHHPIPSSKMTVNVLYDGFDSLTHGKMPVTYITKRTLTPKWSHHRQPSQILFMKMKSLCNGCPCPSQQQGGSSQPDPQINTCMYAKVNKYNSVIPTTDQNAELYDFAESISDSFASGEKTSYYTCDKLK